MRRKRLFATALAVPAVLLVLAALPRLIAANYGLPHVYNADEPHMVNMAVSLSGSLRPYSFKYPTFWPTVLAVFYGAWFLLWSVFGFRRGPTDFAALYAFHPTGFFLIARLLAGACQLGALVVIARVERERDERRWPYGALVLAAAPVLVELAHAAKPDSLMFLLICGTYAAALRFQQGADRPWLRAAAFLAGLSCSTQYTAAPTALLVPLAWLLRADGPAPALWLFEAGALAALGFAVGTPFALIDHRRFIANWSDFADLGRLKPHDAVEIAKMVAKNFWTFAGSGSLAGVAAVIGLFDGFKRNAKRAVLLIVPSAVYAALLSASYDGGVPRYLIGAYPALALFAGEGFSRLGGAGVRRRALIAVLAVAPGLVLSGQFVSDLLRPDTRAQATEWLNANVRSGATLLLDQPHAGPFAIMTEEQCRELAERAAASGSPRGRLYRAMASRHPGGGYRIYRVQRTARDLWSFPQQVALSQADGDFLDVRAGLDPVRAVRAEWVVTSSFGADPRRARELATFFSELDSEADLVKEFPSGPGAAMGPWLRVYHLRR